MVKEEQYEVGDEVKPHLGGAKRHLSGLMLVQ
jgi:hypothetical protein